MKKLLSLMLAMALICSLSLAAAENRNINRFLISMFDHLGSVDLDRQALTFSMTDYGSTLEASIQRRGGLAHLELREGSQRIVVEFTADAVWYLDEQSGQGGWLRFDEIEELAKTAMSAAGTFSDVMGLFGMGSSVDLDLDLDFGNLLASVFDYLSMLLDRGLSANSGRSPYEIAFRLSERDIAEISYQWMDKLIHTPKYLDAWYGVAKSLIGAYGGMVGGMLGDDDYSDALGLFLDLSGDLTEFDTKDALVRQWDENKEETYRQMTAGAGDTIVLDAAVDLTSEGDFVSLRVREGDSPDILTIAYEGSELVIAGEGVSDSIRISADTDSELVIRSDYSSRALGRLRLTDGSAWRLEAVGTSDYGEEQVLFSLGVAPGFSFTPLSEDSRVLHLTDVITRSLPGYGTDYSDLYNLFEYGSDW